MKSLSTILALATLAVGLSGAENKKPNVLLICVDDLKPVLGCYGDSLVKSPNIDRLAQRGVLFDKAYCNQAVCAPSRNALMTGKRPTTLGIYDLGTFFRKAAPDAVTLSQYFMQHGWRAEALGKIFHVGHGNHNDAESWSVPHWSPKGGGYALESSQAKRELVGDTMRGPSVECADVPDNRYGDGMIADEAVTRLRAAREKPDEPFFLAVGFLKPHLPFVAPKKYWDLYERSSFKPHPRQTPPEGAPVFAPTTWGELRNYTDISNTGPLTDAQQCELIHGYYAAVSYMDAQLGRVLDELDRLGLSKSTIIAFWGDHGWHLGDHGMWCKHTNYEQAGRIPLIVSAPSIGKADAKTGALAETVDIYPTLCELAGLLAPKGLDGASFVAALKNPAAAVTKEAVFHAYPRSPRGMGELIGRAVRTSRYRLVEWKVPGAAPDTAILELYDYADDPEETKNLAESHSQVVAQLRAILAKQLEAKPQLRLPPQGPAGATKAKAGKSRQDRGAMFDRRDQNGDGKLTHEEFLIGQPDPQEAPKRFPRFDTNNDGMLTREEFINAGNSSPAAP